MSKLLVVFGATGNQGGSVVQHVLNDAELSQVYRIRAVTRDTSSKTAQALANKGVEVVAADSNDRATLPPVLNGAETVFALSVTNYAGDDGHSEYDQGKNLVDVAVAEGVHDKYRNVTSFDIKANIEQYLRSQPIQSAFYSPGSFMQNYLTVARPQPNHPDDGTYTIAGPVGGSTQLPLVDIAEDTGKFEATILTDPAKFEGKTICGATKMYTMDEQAEILSKATGKKVRYKEVPEQVYRSFMPDMVLDQLTEMRLYQGEFGYYGPDTQKLVGWSTESAKGNLSTFGDFLARNPLHLA